MNDRMMSKHMLPLEAFITLGRHVVILLMFLLMFAYVCLTIVTHYKLQRCINWFFQVVSYPHLIIHYYVKKIKYCCC